MHQTIDSRKFLFSLLTSKDEEFRHSIFNELCRQDVRVLIARRALFYKWLSLVATNKWRRKIARHLLEHHRRQFSVASKFNLA